MAKTFAGRTSGHAHMRGRLLLPPVQHRRRRAQFHRRRATVFASEPCSRFIMKITIVQGAFLPVPMKRGGAVEKVWFGLGQEFARLGYDVTHVSRLCDGLPAEETIAGVKHRRVHGYDAPRSLMKLKWCDYLYSRRAAKVVPKSDIVVTN